MDQEHPKVDPGGLTGSQIRLLDRVHIEFPDERTYITGKVLPTTRYIELVGKKEFVAISLDLEYETYVVLIGSVSFIALLSFFPLNANIHSSHRSQISGLIIKEALINISAKYLDFADVFFLDLVSKLPKHIRINDHAIKLFDS